MMGNATNEIIKKLFHFLLQKYQEGLEESMKWSKSVFYKLRKISLNSGGSCIDSPEWLKNKINAKIKMISAFNML